MSLHRLLRPRGGRLTDEHRAAMLGYAAHAIAAATPLSSDALRLVTLLDKSAEAFGLGGLLPAADSLAAAALTRPLLHDLAQRLRDQARGHRSRRGGFERRLHALARLVGLDAAGRAILGLCLRHEAVEPLEELCDHLADGCGRRHLAGLLPRVIATLTGLGMAVVTRALAPAAPLLASGLLHVNADGTLGPARPVLRYAGNELAGPDARAALLGPAAAASLAWADHAHLGAGADTVAAVLAGALETRARGVHVLLHGPPGTGKTEFAKTLASRLGVPLHAVTEADEGGDEPTREERLSGWRLAQSLTAAAPALLLLDEAEDLFAEGRDGFGEMRRASRVFMHRLLEGTPTPTVWTVNDLGALSPAVRRRMTCCLELRVPPAPVRAALWRRLAAAEQVTLPPADAEALARAFAAPPALARSALRAARLAGGDSARVRQVLLGTARALLGRHGVEVADHRLAAPCDPALLNADLDLATLAERLARPDAPRAVSLLLSGPPGSGKSLFARHLAARMGLEVIERRASDLLDPYLGGTEKAIAAAFAQARECGAFLVFDEADSLLGDRAGATRSWEVSQVNEMLTWMEAHPLPFACTTNLPERLDPASLRRFLLKARFGYLAPGQVALAFERFFGRALPAGHRDLGCLTPADFALVRRKAELLGRTDDVAALCDLLATEAVGRCGGSRRIGFTAIA